MLKSTHKVLLAQGAPSPLAEGWTEHTAPTGHKYYYNAATKQSTYTRPIVEPEDEPLQIDFNATQPDLEIRASQLALEQFQGQQQPQRHEQPRRRGHGGDRPKSKAVIPNCAPWLLVKTKFGRRFVHNTETKQSLWKFPQDVMMAVIDMDRVEWEAKQKKQEEAETEEAGEMAKGDVVARANAAARVSDEDSDSYEEVEVTDEEGDENDAKRRRLSPSNEGAERPVEFDEGDIEWQLAQMQENEYGGDDYPAEDEDDGLPMTEEDNIALFRALLDDFRISPYAEFEKVLEDGRVIEDYRYISLPNMHRRKDVFLDWSRDRTAELQERQKLEEAKKADPKIVYLVFLQRHATPKLFWPEFKRKFKKEPEMKEYEPSEKDKEKLYRELVAKLKLVESDRRKELVALLKSASKAHITRQSKANDLPDIILKDVRYYLIDGKRRTEMVEGFVATL